MDNSMLPKLGAVIAGFTVARLMPNIAEISAAAVELVHKQTGMRFLKLIPHDAAYIESTFAITFPTPPTNDAGLPHICEHSVLCGSDRFPLKEPFGDLLQGSLQTFLNAFTYGEHTVYPFSTRCKQDFYNIMDIYLDAVFSPLLLHDDRIFGQEGWHLHYEGNESLPEGTKPVPEERGVVLNEMRGVYSNPERLGSYHLSKVVFKDSCLGKESGGHPDAIVTLTADDLRNFHKKHYNPKNSFVVIHGRNPLEEELSFIHDRFLAKYDHMSGEELRNALKTTPMDMQRPLIAKPEEPIRVDYPVSAQHAEGGEDALKTEGIFMRLYRLFDSDKIFSDEVLSMTLLDYILFDMPSSPVPNYIKKLGLASSLKSSLDFDQNQATIELTASGVNAHDEAQFTAYRTALADIFSLLGGTSPIPCTLQEEYSTYMRFFEKDSVVSALAHIEFKMREKKENEGLEIILRVFRSWVYGANFEKYVEYETALKRVKDRIANGSITGYLQNLVRKYFIFTYDVADCILKPVPGLGERQAEERKAKLAKTLDDLYAQDRADPAGKRVQALIDNSLRVIGRQKADNTPEALATLPKLTEAHLEGLDKAYLGLRGFLADNAATHGVPTFVFNTKDDGKGIVYFEARVDMSDVATEDTVHTLSLLAKAILGKVATASHSADDLQSVIDRYTGDLRFSVEALDSRHIFQADGTHTRSKHNAPRVALKITMKCLAENFAQALELVFHEILGTSFVGLEDLVKLEQNAKQFKDDTRHAIVNQDSHFVAARRALAAGGHLHSLVLDHLSGYGFYTFISSVIDSGKCSLVKADDCTPPAKATAPAADAAADRCADDLSYAALSHRLAELLTVINKRRDHMFIAMGLHAAGVPDYGDKEHVSAAEVAKAQEAVAHLKVQTTLQRVLEKYWKKAGQTPPGHDAAKNSWFAVPHVLPMVGTDGGKGLLDKMSSIAAPIDVNYVARGAYLPDKDVSGVTLLAHNLLSRQFLWDHVRVEGGAYGCILRVEDDGKIYVTSYRDPQIAKTMANYDNITTYLRGLALTPEEVLKFKIGAIGARQIKLSPAQRYESALALFITGHDVSAKAKQIREIVHCDLKAIKEEASFYAPLAKGPTFVFGKVDAVKEASASGLIGPYDELK